MIIQHYPDELDYVNAILAPAGPKAGSFLSAFCQACAAADWENYELLRPILAKLIEKYPADPERLKAERRDRESTQ